jgi:hypothetical protein
MSRAGLDDWRDLERLARESGAWNTAAEALFTQALLLVPDHADDARLHAERAIELCESRGLREALAWSHYVIVEVGLVSGDWDGAVAAARRALDIGIASGYDRAVVRTWSAVLPIAAARGERALLEEAHVWLTERFREPESPSPYALIMQSARLLELVGLGLREPFVPAVEERLPSFGLPYSTPSWLAGIETVFDSWLGAGELEGASRALERMAAGAGRGSATLGRATGALFAAKLLAARGEDPAEEAARALAGFRESQAPWWIAKALRLLGTPEALAEAAETERALGIPALKPNG